MTGVGSGVGFGSMVGVGAAALILSEALIVIEGPLEGVNTTVAVCVPGASPVTLADIAIIEDAPSPVATLIWIY